VSCSSIARVALPLLASGCLATSGTSAKKFEAWKVDDRVGLPGASAQAAPGAGAQQPPGAGAQQPPGAGAQQPSGAGAQPAAQPATPPATRVVVVPSGATLAEPGATRALCSGKAPCDLLVPRGSRFIHLYSGAPTDPPAASFWLDVDPRPMKLEVERPKVGLAITGAMVASVGLLSVVLGAVALEGGGNEDLGAGLLIGGLAGVATGFGLGGIYWATGRGQVHASPLAE